jgi:ribosomal protein L11 methyltransferase
MPWIQLKLNTTGANAEELSDALMEAGSVSITFQDTHDTPVFEPLPGETRLWGDTDVIGLFDAETDMKEVVAILENHPLLGAGFVHKIEQLEDKDWEREWMDNFHPMQFGKRLWICPSWRDVPDENAVNVMLDPGLAFGTGTHPIDFSAIVPFQANQRSRNRYQLFGNPRHLFVFNHFKRVEILL